MGMFDTVTADCPNCGETVEFQSKAGPCILGHWDINSAPPEVANDVKDESRRCECGSTVEFKATHSRIVYTVVCS